MIESQFPKDDEPKTPKQQRIDELASEYEYESELAFFIVNFHMSVAEFNLLSETEKMFIYKEHENKFVFDTTWTRNAVLNAEANINRKKGKRFIELFPKKQATVDKEFNAYAMKVAEEMDKRDGKAWVRKVLGLDKKK